ncbi:anti-anti-sigma factor [Bacillus sp. FJAT-27225]|uniref:STAS domain-containing protein n=1 Tax=Bacillus sp. FJAT-27225 TaxID=1743144 RepID=UPI00080C300A|nr:STAS domain-containing protein [Bacillus sp. FJAT-27225]OCA81606.1 anti-anti-sigma factor [Bacillus sp. FJAT-27225]
MSSMSEISSYLGQHAKQLAKQIVESVVQRFDTTLPEWEIKQAIKMYEELLGYLSGALLTGDEEEVPEALVSWSKRNAEAQAEAGGSISEIIVRYSPTREVFADLLTAIGGKFDLSREETTHLIKWINKLMDVSMNETVSAFERLTEEYKAGAEMEMAELSAPIVPLLDDMAVIPLIGEMNQYRVKYILERVIPRVSAMEIKRVIIDFSGIKNIDDHIAHSLHEIGSVFKLLGIRTIVTGLRPELAKMVVQSGLSISTFEIYANVKQALKKAH